MSGDGGRKPEKRYPKFEPLAETLARVIDNIKSRTGKPEYPTGLEVLDRGIWGLHKSQLTTIASRPAVGKTAMACNMALHLAKNNIKVAFLSLEMMKETLIERMFCCEHAVDSFQLLMGNVDVDIQSKYSKYVASVGLLPLSIIDDYCFTENELYTLIDHLEFRPQVIILDHLQHIRGTSRQSQWETLTNYLRFLKEVAMRHRIAVVVLSQINREGDNKPSLATLKGTGAIEEMSDHVILLHRLPEQEATQICNFQAVVAKNRFGPAGKFDLWFDEKSLKFI